MCYLLKSYFLDWREDNDSFLFQSQSFTSLRERESDMAVAFLQRSGYLELLLNLLNSIENALLCRPHLLAFH